MLRLGIGFKIRLGLGFRVRLGPGYIYRYTYIHDLPHVPPLRMQLRDLYTRSSTLRKLGTIGKETFYYSCTSE